MKKYREMSPEEKEIFMDGVNYARAYIDYCLFNFPLEFNWAGMKRFMEGLRSFMDGGNYIDNFNKLTFKEFVEQYKHKL